MSSTYSELISQFQGDRDRARERARTASDAARAILDRARAAGRHNLTSDEGQQVETLISGRDAANGAADDAQRKLDQLEAARAEDDQLDQRLATPAPHDQRTTATMPAYDRVARVGREERTYRVDQDRSGKGFLLDVTRSHLFGDVRANERLSRHMTEEETERPEYMTRAGGVVGTAQYTGLVVPQYLTDLYAPATATLRPIADVATQHALPPDGMTLNISRITTPTAVGLQTSENTAVTSQDIDDTNLVLNVQTAAGQQTISRQAAERGTGIEDVTLQDLYRRYASNLDSTIITQASTGLAAVAQGTTYTDASPTAALLWPYLFQAQSKLEAALLGQATPNYVAMHSRRWNWLCSQVGTTWPFLGSGSIPAQMGGMIVTNEYGAGVRGVLSNGMKVIVDNNIETTVGGTQDPIYVLASGELHLWEDPNAPMLIRAEQPAAASLGVLLVVYSYFAYTASRYANNPGRITGTGMAAPAGF